MQLLVMTAVVGTVSIFATSPPTPPGTFGWANVRDFGAAGDGVTDDYTPVAAALASLNATGGTLYFPPGTYALSQTIAVVGVTAVTLRGAGKGCLSGMGTCLVAFSGAPEAPLARSVVDIINASHIVLADLAIRGSLGLTGISVERTFWARLEHLALYTLSAAVIVADANTVTMDNILVEDTLGPAAFDFGAGPGGRTDIVQMARITTNNVSPGANATCIWIHMGQGMNTLRLNGVGLISGGVGVRMDSDFPAGVSVSSPSKPLFLFANDLEVDFAGVDCVQLVTGRVANFVNSYIQGAGTGFGIAVLATWSAEFQISNSRIFGNAQAAISLGGGVDAVITGNIMDNNALSQNSNVLGVDVQPGLSNLVITSNIVNYVAQTDAGRLGVQTCGIRIQAGASNNYIVANNVCANVAVAVVDAGTGLQKQIAGNLPMPPPTLAPHS